MNPELLESIPRPTNCSHHIYDEQRDNMVSPEEVKSDLDLADWSPIYIMYSEISVWKYMARGFCVEDIITSHNYSALIGSICVLEDGEPTISNVTLGTNSQGLLVPQEVGMITILEGFLVKDIETFYSGIPDKTFTG